MEIREYPKLTKIRLVYRLADLVQELVGLYDEFAHVKVTEHSLKMQGWAQSQSTNVTGRRADSDYQAQTATLAVIEMECRIKALEEEKWFLQRCLDNGWLEG